MNESDSRVANRAILVVPGGEEHKISKAEATVGTDLVFDLEDAVAVIDKSGARAVVCRHLQDSAGMSARRRAVRVNAPRTPWCHEDLLAIVEHEQLTSIVVPKVENAGDIAFVDRLLQGIEAAVGRTSVVRIQALIESAQGFAELFQIASASPRVESLIIGYADLAADLGRDPNHEPSAWSTFQDLLVNAARANSLQPLDGPFLAPTATDEFRRAVRIAKERGFDGKWIIHPDQIEEVRLAFTPTDDEVEHARSVLRALDAASTSPRGVAVVEGRMVDEALARSARRVLAGGE